MITDDYLSYYQKQDSKANPFCVPAGYCASNDDCDVKLTCRFGVCVLPILRPALPAHLRKNDGDGKGLSPIWIAVIVIGAIEFVVFKKMRGGA